MRLRVQAGLASELDVEQAPARLENTRAQAPSLESAIAVATHRLDLLLGEQPNTLTESTRRCMPVAARLSA